MSDTDEIVEATRTRRWPVGVWSGAALGQRRWPTSRRMTAGSRSWARGIDNTRTESDVKDR